MIARLARLTRTTTAAICAMVVLVVAGTTAAIATTSAASTTGAVTGTISDPSGYPLAGITVRLYDDGPDDGDLVGTTTTNDAGRYRFASVRTDGDDLHRFDAKDVSGAHVFLYSSSFPVAGGTTTTHNGTMQIAGLVQGKVSTQVGSAPAQPGKHVYVSATGRNGRSSALVSARGRFRLGGLPSGTYALAFQDSDDAFAPQCYNNVRTGDNGCGGTAITVTAGRTTTISPQLLDHPTSAVSGTVTDAARQPLESIGIRVYTSTNHLIDDSYTKADGTWSLRGIAYVGKVKVVALAEDGEPWRTTWYAGAVDFAHATPITVNEGAQVTKLHITMPSK